MPKGKSKANDASAKGRKDKGGKAKGGKAKGGTVGTAKGTKTKGPKAGRVKAAEVKGGSPKGAKTEASRSSGRGTSAARTRRGAEDGSPSRLSGPHTWTIEQLASSVPRFEESLRASGLAETTVRNYVTRSISFLAFVEQERSDEDADV